MKNEEKIVVFFEKSLSYAGKQKDSQINPVLDSFIKELEQKFTNSTDEALLCTILTKFLNFSEKYNKEPSSILSLHYNISKLSIFSKNYQKSLFHAQKSLEISKNTNSAIDTIHAYDLLSGIFYQIGNYDNALYFLSEAEKVLKANPNSSLLKVHYKNVYSVYFAKKEYEKAKMWLIKYYEEIKKEADINEAINVGYSIAELDSLMGNYELSISNLIKALEFAKSTIGQTNSINSEILTQIGLVYSNMKNYEKSNEFYHQSFEIKKKVLGELNFELC